MHLNAANECKEKQDNRLRRERNEVDVFRKSQIKESEIIMEGICCSRHMQCIDQSHKQHDFVEDQSLSVDSELLVEIEPVNISAEPLFEFQVKPEIDMLAQVNIKRKQYEKMLHQYEDQKRKQQRNELLQKVRINAQKALQANKEKNKDKKLASPKRQWGHSIFTPNVQVKDLKPKDNQSPAKQIVEVQEVKKKVQMKPIKQRIIQYREQQANKLKESDVCCLRSHKQNDIDEQNKKIQMNAEKILENMKNQKMKKEDQRKIIQAKIRALQIKALEKVQIAKKKPLDPGQEFELGDSQYSTFSARAQNRKMMKKKKKEKPKPAVDPSLLDTKKTYVSKFPKREKSSSNLPNSKTRQLLKTQQLARQQQQRISQQQKGPFYIWNMPVTSEDLQKLDEKEEKMFINVDRFNYKSGKTFREQAQELLAQKMAKKRQTEKQTQKQSVFQQQVQKKKQILKAQYDKYEGPKIMQQPIWNEDEVFRPNVLENFHFYTKNAPY